MILDSTGKEVSNPLVKEQGNDMGIKSGETAKAEFVSEETDGNSDSEDGYVED